MKRVNNWPGRQPCTPFFQTNPIGYMPRLNPPGSLRVAHNPAPKGTFVAKVMLIRHRSGKLVTMIRRDWYGDETITVHPICAFMSKRLKSIQLDRLIIRCTAYPPHNQGPGR